MSAANKLGDHHPKRSEELKDWAKKGGISALASPDLDRDYYYPFIFENYKEFEGKGPYWEDALQGEFFITGYEIVPQGQLSRGFNAIKVKMISDFGVKLVIRLVMQIEFSKMSFEILRPNERDLDSNWFRFENRKDALHFRKYVTDIAFEEGLDDLYNIETLPINDLYTSK